MAFAAPVAAAVLMARDQARQIEDSYTLELARSAVTQVENTVDQFVAAARAIDRLGPDAACTPPGLDVMRRIDLGSPLLQGVGWVEGNYLRCSSFAGTTPLYIGPHDFISGRGARVRRAVAIIGPEPRYVVIQVRSAATILHPQLALSFVQDVPGAAVIAFSWSQRQVLLQRGDPPGGLLEGNIAVGVTRRSDGSTMAVSRSKRDDVAALVLLPPRYGMLLQPARQLVPAGIMIGLILAGMFVLAVRRRNSLRMRIRSALANGDFYLAYQPIMAVETGTVVAAEALIRWRRKGALEIGPDLFIPVAEQRGLMPELTECVFRLLENDVPHLLAAASDIELAINLSAVDLHRTDLVGRLLRFERNAGIALSSVIIEATERSLLDPGRAAPSLAALRENAVRVAIDDFGTGYSSLAYLAVLEVDILKIDKLFTQALGTGSATSQVAQGIIEMARALNLVAVAEGVETAEQEAVLRALGVDRAQGYYYARPMPLEQMVSFLKERAGGPPMNPPTIAPANVPRSKRRSRPAVRR